MYTISHTSYMLTPIQINIYGIFFTVNILTSRLQCMNYPKLTLKKLQLNICYKTWLSLRKLISFFFVSCSRTWQFIKLWSEVNWVLSDTRSHDLVSALLGTPRVAISYAGQTLISKFISALILKWTLKLHELKTRRHPL